MKVIPRSVLRARMATDLAISTLKLNWQRLSPKARKNLICSLTGRGMNFEEIAEETGRTIQEINDAGGK